MDKGKSKYVFAVNVPYQVIEDAIQNYLKKEKFELQNEDGVRYYLHFDGVWGNRFFEYFIEGNQVTIYAYIGKYKHPKALDEGIMTQAKEAYCNSLSVLFHTLQMLHKTEGDPERVEDCLPNMTYVGATVKSPEDEEKANGNKAIIGFILSVVGLVLPCVGIQFGWIVIIVEFIFATAGLKSSKKGLAIATFVLAGIQTLFLIITLILRLMVIWQ